MVIQARQRTVPAIFALILAGTAIGVQAAGVKQKIRFERGRSATVIKNAVIRGETDEYTIHAQAKQVLSVHVKAVEDNAVFQIYQPGRKKALARAGEGDDAKTWKGKLPATGDYTIVVGGTRGNASYTLAVSIR